MQKQNNIYKLLVEESVKIIRVKNKPIYRKKKKKKKDALNEILWPAYNLSDR